MDGNTKEDVIKRRKERVQIHQTAHNSIIECSTGGNRDGKPDERLIRTYEQK